MGSPIIVAIISAFGSILVASIMFFLTKRHERKAEWQQQKLQHYKALLSAISDVAFDGSDKVKANEQFALTANTIALVAPQYVIDALMAFHDEVKWSNRNRTAEKHDELLNKLFLAIRKDIGLSSKDNPKTFSIHLIGGAPPGVG